MIGDEIAAAALRYVGTPYQRRGRSRLGCDCGGIVIGCAREVRALPYRWDFTDYHAAVASGLFEWPNADFVAEVAPNAELVASLQPGPAEILEAETRDGDVLMLSAPHRPGVPYHVGIRATYQGVAVLVHIHHRTGGRVAAVPLERYARGMIVRVWRFRGPWPTRPVVG